MLPTFNVPPIGPRQGKDWGITQLIFAHNSVECHRIQVNKGGYSSVHVHKHKWNRFVVVKGRLKIRIFLGDDREDVTIIEAGQVSDVPPGVRHGFEALEDTEALELYWVTLEAGDIDRGDSQGGMKDEIADKRDAGNRS